MTIKSFVNSGAFWNHADNSFIEAVFVHCFAVVALVGHYNARSALFQQCRNIDTVAFRQHAHLCRKHFLSSCIDENVCFDRSSDWSCAVNPAQIMITWIAPRKECAVNCSNLHIVAVRGSKQALPQSSRQALRHLYQRRIRRHILPELAQQPAYSTITQLADCPDKQGNRMLPELVLLRSKVVQPARNPRPP